MNSCICIEMKRNSFCIKTNCCGIVDKELQVAKGFRSVFRGLVNGENNKVVF